MTIDEAIHHCEEVAERYETRAKIIDRRKLGFALENPTTCRECAADHRQLAEWLMELKDLRAEQNDQYVFIHELMSELAEAKRLLKAAVEDMNEENFCAKVCKRDNFACRVSDTCDFKWRYADEAKKLLNDEK